MYGLNGTSYLSCTKQNFKNQINTIFANAETVAGKDGGNSTALGKAGSSNFKKLQAEIDKLPKAPPPPPTGIIKNFDPTI